MRLKPKPTWNMEDIKLALLFVTLEETEQWHIVEEFIWQREGMNFSDLWLAFGNIRRYYKKVDSLTNINYKRGREFEYAVMKYLRDRGWHCMRRFGSHNENVCEKCGWRTTSKIHKCRKCGGHILHVPLDVTAAKDGVYLMISCKYSHRRGTYYMDDPLWTELAKYAQKFDAVPIFAGVTQERKMYFVDLRVLDAFDQFYRFKTGIKPDQSAIERLIGEAWSVIELANEILDENKQPRDDCKKCKVRIKWANNKKDMINVLNRVLWRAGAVGTGDDLTKILESNNNKQNQTKNQTEVNKRNE